MQISFFSFWAQVSIHFFLMLSCLPLLHRVTLSHKVPMDPPICPFVSEGRVKATITLSMLSALF